MNRVPKKSILITILFLVTANVYAQKLKILRYTRINNSDSAFSLNLIVEVSNNSDTKIILPNPIPSTERNSFKLSNITSFFFNLKSTDEIFVNFEYPPSPEEYGAPKLKDANLMVVEPQSSAVFEMNTGNFEYDGLVRSKAKNPKVSLVYDPKLKYLDRKRHLEESISTVNFYDKKIESNVVVIK